VRNDDPDLLLEQGLWAQRYGVDIISITAVIALLMTLYEKGIITAKDTDGIAMEWGSREAIMGMFDKIVHRKGFGDVLADGLIPAAQRIGQGAMDYAYQVKGLPQYAPRTPHTLIPLKGRALSLVVSSRGDSMRTMEGREVLWEQFEVLKALEDEQTADGYVEDLRQRAKAITGTSKAAMPESYEGKPELVAYSEDRITVGDCLSACKYMGGSDEDSPFDDACRAALFSAGTGIETSVDSLFEYAKRVRNLERAYCVREGMTRDTDSLPKGYMDHPIERGRFKGEMLETSRFEKMKDQYYAIRGWDIATGIPSRETLAQAGLGDVAQDLETRGKLPVS